MMVYKGKVGNPVLMKCLILIVHVNQVPEGSFWLLDFIAGPLQEEELTNKEVDFGGQPQECNLAFFCLLLFLSKAERMGKKGKVCQSHAGQLKVARIPSVVNCPVGT